MDVDRNIDTEQIDQSIPSEILNVDPPIVTENQHEEPLPEQVEIPLEKTTTKRIVQRQKTACSDFFNEQGYNRNTKLPTGGSSQHFNTFLDLWTLNRKQVKTQFINWKKEKYEFYGEVYENDPTRLRAFIESHMSIESAEFIGDITNQMMADPTKEIPKWFTMVSEQHSFYNIVLPQMTADPFRSIFVDILDQYILTLLIK